MEFTYIDLVNGFNDWCYDNMLDIKSQIIFFKMLYVTNRCEWLDWVEISNMRLMHLSGFQSEKSFIRFRDKLIELGFIEYRKGKKGQPNKYKIITDNFEKIKEKYSIKCSVKKCTQNETTNETKSDTQSETTNDTHNKTKDKELRLRDTPPTHSGENVSEKKEPKTKKIKHDYEG